MAYIVRMPQLGLEMERGTLVEWYVDEGDAVEEGEPVAEIESEKTTAEVDAREAGVLRRVYLAAGETTEPGGPIGIVAEPDADIEDLEAQVDEGAAAASADAAEEALETDEPTGSAGASETPAESESGAGQAEPSAVKASPRAEKRAEELGVDLTAIDGSGPGGAITADDVEEAAESAREETAEAPSAAEPSGGASLTVAEERPFKGMRQTIATRLGESYRNAVHVTEHRSADAEALLAAADAADEALDENVTVNDILLVALSATLDEHPAFNARFEDDVHRIYEEHNVGIAVDVDSGLIAPVIPDVGSRSIEDIAAVRQETTRRALEGEYTMDDLANGTFTVSNLGVLGVESFDPIINPPQVAILGVDAIETRAVEDESEVAFRRRLPLDLSFDHRIVDGADAARFLETLVGHLEDPWDLLPDAVEARPAGPVAETEMPHRSVSASLVEGLRGTVEAGSFTVPFDEPEDVGGSETAPAPVDLFLSSLVACLAESINFQAVEKYDLDLRDVTVDATASPESGAVESIDVTVHLDVDADDDQLERVVEFGERTCHVSQLLRDDLDFEIDWDRAGNSASG
ncbi:MAG: 2-oxo acid dehydrogenase subunit E2 [Halanaeroarchaeum sp.]